MEERLKIELELHVFGDGRTFLNFWNHQNGDDVIAELRDGKLYMDIDDVEFEVPFQKFVDDVKGKC